MTARDDSENKSASSLFDEILGNNHGETKESKGLGTIKSTDLLEERVEDTDFFEDNVISPEIDEKSKAVGNVSESSLPPELKKSLVHLYRSGSILMSQNKDRYEILCRYENDVRKHLSDVYMDVIFDKKAGHIFTQVLEPDDSDEDFVRLVTVRRLSLYQSILLVVIRKYFQERETAGEQHIVIDLDRLESFLVPYLDLSHSSRKEQEKLRKAVSALVDKRILISIRGEQERFQISPIIRNVVNAEFLENLLEEYQRMLGSPGVESKK